VTTVHQPVDETSALPALREALRNGSPCDQVLAAEQLGLLGDGTGTGVLESAVSDEDRPVVVRRAAATALGRIGWTRSTDPLSRVLARSEDPALRCAAAEALGRIGDPAALPALTAGLASPAVEVRRTCAGALSRLGAEGREWLGVLAAGGGVAADAAREALESVTPRF
jgi:HEAT repeat protein